MIWDILLAIGPVALLGFVAATLVLNLTPGADFVFITASSVQGGTKVGIGAALGINLGIVIHIAAAAAGVSALLLANPALFDAIRYAGAAYLLWLAYGAWRASGTLGDGRGAPTPRAAFRRGFGVNILNPKTALFIFAFIPQFAVPGVAPIWAQILVLGALFTIQGVIFAVSLAALAGAASHLLRSRVGILNKVTAILFGGLAARLVLD